MFNAKLPAALLLSFLVSSLEAEELIKDKSPDGKFALQLISGKKGWDTAIIDARTKTKIVDLENIAISGDEDRLAWVRSAQTFYIENYGKDATLLWSNDSQRVAYFNESRISRATSVYFRNGDKFEEVKLPEFPRCDELKHKNPNDLTTIFYTVTPKYWTDSGELALHINGDWKDPHDQFIGCEQSLTIAFDEQHRASVAKAMKPRNPSGRKIESPNGTFFVEELDVVTKDSDGQPQPGQEVWVVSAKDPAQRERLPGFEADGGGGGIAGVAISPDENWMLVAKHHGSHMNSTHFFHRKEEVKFDDVFPDSSFDDQAWKFFCKVENVPKSKIDETDNYPEQAIFVDWSSDSARMLIDLHGGLTGKDTYYRSADFKKPGVSLWLAYFNTRTQKFELTDILRANNKGARKRWNAMSDEDAEEDGIIPPSAEPVGREGHDAPVAERLKNYETQLAALVRHRESQLEGDDRAEFQKKEKDWREGLDDIVAKVKDKQAQLGLRARSTWYHLRDVRQDWLPIYESQTEVAKTPQP